MSSTHFQFTSDIHTGKFRSAMDSSLKYLSQCAGIFQLFGHQFFGVKSLSADTQSKKPSLAYKIYFVVLLVALTGQMGAYSFINGSDNDSVREQLNAKTALNAIFQYSTYFGLILTISVTLIQTYVATPLIKKFYINCMRFSRSCVRDFNHVIDYRRLRNNFFRNVALLTLFYFLLEAFFYFYEVSCGIPQVWMKTIFDIMPISFLILTVVKFVYLVELINFHLGIIHNLVKEVFKRQTSLKIYVKPSKLEEPPNLKAQVRNLRRMYRDVSDNSELINQSMGLTMLAIIIVAVVHLIASGHRLFLVVVGTVPAEKIGGD